MSAPPARRVCPSAALVALAVLGPMALTPALASPQLAQARNCLACHQVDRKVIGPSFKDVAARYAGQKNAQAMLVNKLLKGGVGAWGPVPKPPATQLSPEEAQTLVRWILAMK